MERGRRGDTGGVLRGGVASISRTNGAKFESARRVVRILDLVGRGGPMTAKALSREIGVSLSTCYRLIGILMEEGFLSKTHSRGEYGLGPAVAALRGEQARREPEAFKPVVAELARRSGRHAYFGVLSDGAVAVSHVESPPGSPPVGIVRGFRGASHALALGKVLLASTGPSGAVDYALQFGLEAFTPRTIVRKDLLECQFGRIRSRGFAVDVEEFTENLCCVAAPVLNSGGEAEGAIGVSTSAGRFEGEARSLLDLVRRAAEEASSLLPQDAEAAIPSRDLGGSRAAR